MSHNQRQMATRQRRMHCQQQVHIHQALTTMSRGTRKCPAQPAASTHPSPVLQVNMHRLRIAMFQMQRLHMTYNLDLGSNQQHTEMCLSLTRSRAKLETQQLLTSTATKERVPMEDCTKVNPWKVKMCHSPMHRHLQLNILRILISRYSIQQVHRSHTQHRRASPPQPRTSMRLHIMPCHSQRYTRQLQASISPTQLAQMHLPSAIQL